MAKIILRADNTYRLYLIGLLILVSSLVAIDRILLSVVLESIKSDLVLSDTQLGFLGGLGFAAFYALVGLPIARLADRSDRVWIMAATTALFGVGMALCGIVSSFLQLLVARIGVAVGEAGGQPTSMSLIAEYFPREERPYANSLYSVSGPIGCVVGFFGGGILNDIIGWRMTFLVMGVPGILVALTILMTAREPRRNAPSILVSKPPSTREVIAALFGNRAFRFLVSCLILSYLFMYGILQWLPAFFIRSHHLSSSSVGLWFAITFGLGGVIGLYVSGIYCSRYARSQEKRQLRFLAFAFVVAGAASFAIYLTANLGLAFVFLGLHMAALNSANAPLNSTIQTIVPEPMRATAFALIYMLANLIGMGFGPLIIGMLSDYLHSQFGTEALRYALIIVSPGYLLAAWQAWAGSNQVADTSD
jgi:MFS family permease